MPTSNGAAGEAREARSEKQEAGRSDLPAPCSLLRASSPDALARHLLLQHLRRAGDGPEPTYGAVAARWEAEQHHWLAVARDALVWRAHDEERPC